LKRSVGQHRFVAGCLRPNPTGSGRTLGDPSLDVLWATAQDLEVPLCFHNALNTDVPQAGLDRARSFVLGHAIVHPLEQMLAFSSLLEAGVFDRFARLRFGFMESNCGWLPFWLDRLDEHFERLGWMLAQPPKRKPSEIFRQQCVIGCENEEPMLPYVQERFGENKVLWASDFPHFDAELPGLVGLRKRTDLTQSQREGALWGAAAGFYGLDTEAIARSKSQRRPSQAVAGS
jgi:predicted TIM-barrel fold metal-dependent hydrolase